MEILVCVKQVPDDSVTVKLNESGAPALEDITQVVNAFDTYALEMATRFKEANEGNITVLTVADADAATPSLRSCLSVGANHAAVLNENVDTDAAGIGALLAKCAGKISETPFDMIFCGSESTDMANGQLGIMLAQEMSIPLVTNVLGVELQGQNLMVKQETDDGYRMIETAMPCVLMVVKPDYEPRYPSIKSKMAARKMPIAAFTADDIAMEIPCAKVVRSGISAPAQRQGGVKIQEKDAAVAVSRAMDMMAEQKLL